MRKQIIISALLKFETTHTTDIGSVAIPHNKPRQIRADYVGRMAKKVRKRRRLNPSRKSVNMKLNIRDDDLPLRSRSQRFKGLQNHGNTSYFNSVIQCIFHCPMTKQAIENVPENTISNELLRELRILFLKMTNNDALTYVSPRQCFNAAMKTPECKSENMSIGYRQEDVHEFFVKIMEHFENDKSLMASTFNLLGILNIKLRSTTTCQQCLRSNEVDEYLWQLSLYFPFSWN